MRAVFAICLAASGFAFGAFLAVTTARSFGVLLVAMFGVFVLASLSVFFLAASLSVLLFAASLGVLLVTSLSVLLFAAFFLLLVALMVLSAGVCRSAHHGHDHHGTEQNLFHIVSCY